jgi:hypothetical protein
VPGSRKSRRGDSNPGPLKLRGLLDCSVGLGKAGQNLETAGNWAEPMARGVRGVSSRVGHPWPMGTRAAASWGCVPLSAPNGCAVPSAPSATPCGRHTARRPDPMDAPPAPLSRLDHSDVRDLPAAHGVYAAWILEDDALDEAGIEGPAPVLAYVGKAGKRTLSERLSNHVPAPTRRHRLPFIDWATCWPCVVRCRSTCGRDASTRGRAIGTTRVG